MEKRRRKKKVNKKLQLFAEFLICSLIIFSIFGLRNSYGKIFLKEEQKDTQTTKQEVQTNNTQTEQVNQEVKQEKLTPDQLTVRIDEIISQYNTSNNKIAVVYNDLKSGYRYGLNDKEYFSAASTTKVVYALYIYDRIEKGQLSSNMMIKFDKSLVTAGGGEITNKQAKSQYPIEEVVMNMLTYSDNTATNMLIGNNANAEQVLGYYLNKLNITNVENMTSNNKVTPEIMEKIWLYLYENQEKYPKVIDYLKQSSANEWIKDGITGKLIASKYGAVNSSSHDTAIIYDTKGDYILLIYTDSVSDAGNAIAGIAEKINKLHDDNI